MKQFMALLMLVLAMGFVVPVAVHAAEADETEVHSSDDDGTEDQGSGDAPGTDDSTETADDDDGTEDQGSGDAPGTESQDDSESSDDDGTADQGSGDAVGTTRSAEGDSDDDTNSQVADMDSGIGAEVRLLQLKREIERSALHMDAAIEVVEDSNSSNATSADITSLKSIVAELRLLKDDVDSALEDTSNKEANVQAFLDIKADAKDLVKQFRETIQPLLSRSDKDALKRKLESIDREELKDITDEIAKARREWAADRIESILTAAGISNADLVARVRSGETTIDQARKEVKDLLKTVEKDIKERVKNVLKESDVKRNVFKQDVVLRLREKELERKEDRSGKRADELEKKGFEGAAKRLEERSARLDDRADKLAEERAKLEKRLAQEREKRRSGSSGSGSDDSDDNSGSDSEDDVQ